MTTSFDSPLELHRVVDHAAGLGTMTAPDQPETRAAALPGVMMIFKRHLAPALLVLILGCLAVVGWLVYSNQRAEMESERGERHTREVIQQLGDLLSGLKDAETGQRGFIITGKPDYLAPYQASLAEIATGLANLRRLTADNPRQQQRLDALAPLVAARLAILKEIIALRETQGFPAASAALMALPGKTIMDEIRALVAEAQAQEAQILKERVATHAADNRKTMQSVTLGSALGGLALLLLFIRLRWELASRQRAETASRASEQRLRVATDAAELGIWTWQPDGDRIRWENDKPYDIFSMPRTDAPLTAARFASEFVHAEDLAAFERAIADTVQNGARLFYQGRFQCPDGALRWVEFTGQPVAGTQGPSLRVIGTAQDITRRKQAEEAQARLAKIVETSDDAIISKSLDGIIETWNAGADRMFGYLAKEVVGKPITLLVPPERLPEEEQILRQLQRGKAVEHYETLRLTRDGRLIDVSLTISPLKNADGKVVGASKIVRNITESKRVEAALRESEAFSRSIIKSSPDCIKVLDLEGNLLSMESGQELLGIEDIQPFLNKWWIDFWEGQTDKQAAQAAIASAAAGGAGAFVGFFRTLRGEPKWWDVAISPILDANGQPARLLAVSRDVTGRQQAEDVLRKSEQRFRALVLASSDLMCRMSPDWGEMRQIYDKNFVVEIEAPNSNWLQHYVHRDDQPRLMAAVREAIRSKSLFAMEHRVRRADGSWGWMLSRAVPLLDTRGEIFEWFGTGSDVTDKKRAEQALRESERFLRSSLDALSGHIAVLDESGTILETNAAWQRFGHENHATASGIGVGVNYLQYCKQSLSQDDRTQAYSRGISDVIAGRQTHFEVEYPCHSPTEQRWFVMRVTRFQTPGPVRIVIVHDNCTERRLAEEALRQSEERFRALFDRGPIAIYACDATGAALEFNPCAVQLWGREPKRGDSDERFSGSHKLYRPDGTFVPRAQSPMAAVLSGDNAGLYDEEFIIERPDGSRISIISNTVSLKNEQGKITGGMCCFYDISERKRLEREALKQSQALADLDRRKDEFLAMLSHELRNPLAAMSNAVHLLRLQKEEGPILTQARSIIERQVGQLTNLVDDLLEVSRINTGRVRLRQEPVSVGGIVERAVETAQPMMAQRGHQLDVLLPPQAVFLHADAARLEQVLVNLLTNAAKYTDKGGRIWLSVEAADAAEAAANGKAAVPMVVIKVRDTGMGIAPELLPHIFDLFTQADRSLDRSQGGLGIGLCLVQRLVELHGGTVEAHSVLGQGSEFVVRLPVVQPTLPTVSRPVLDNASPPAIAAKGCRVLVVDDNVDAAQGMARLLEITGHEFRLAYDGPSALEAVMDYQPDVVLLDIGLPGLDGFEVAQRIRQQAALGNIVLVALTGYGQDADRRLAKDAGFDYHLVKPASFSQIEKILLSVSERMT